jgi:phosphate acetyltransferase
MDFRSPFISEILKRCQAAPGKVILPEGDDPRVVSAAKILSDLKVVKKVSLLTTTGRPSGATDDPLIEWVDCRDPSLARLTRETCTSQLQKKNKPTDPNALESVSFNPLYVAGALLDSGDADCVVAGCVATTADVIRAAISTVGLAPGIRTVSGSFIMDRVQMHGTASRSETYIFADCGVVIDPTPQQLCDIAIASCETYRKITDLTPVVAFLSFSTKGSAQHPSAQKMIDATELFRKKAPNIDADGEMQFDAAFVKDIGLRKAPDSTVPGRANCFVFPDLNAGNIAYKITQRLGGFAAYGPILQGVGKPYSDLSRGATPEDIVVSALINILRSR